MRSRHLQRWLWLHKWSSLVCTAFLLITCLTGLPLIFSEEIDRWLAGAPVDTQAAANAPLADVQRMADDSLRRHPGDIIASLFMDDEQPRVIVVMAPSWQAWKERPDSRYFLAFDVHTGAFLQESRTVARNAVTGFMLKLHRDLFAGLYGELFLGLMGLLFMLAIISGLVLYGPYMKKLSFGTVRMTRTRRLQWLDLHNLLGVSTMAWALVVGGTGVLNEIATPLFGLWQQTDVQARLRPWRGQQPPAAADVIPVGQALQRARQALPQMQVFSAVYPGSPIGSPFHYQIWTRGNSALTARLFSPLLIDARSGELTAVMAMPWYLRALEVSRPLHFGDYGSLPLKLIWAILDLLSIAMLASGLYLWLARRGAAQGRLEKLMQAHTSDVSRVSQH